VSKRHATKPLAPPAPGSKKSDLLCGWRPFQTHPGRVVLRFHSNYFLWGALLNIVALIGGIAMMVFPLKRKPDLAVRPCCLAYPIRPPDQRPQR
jgi:hypothetical protein